MKKSQLNKLIKEEIRRVTNEATPSETEDFKIQVDLKRWIKHSMDGGDSEADVLSVLEEYAKTIISKINRPTNLRHGSGGSLPFPPFKD